MLILPNVNHEDDTEIMAKKIPEGFKEPRRIEEHELYVTTSISTALYPDSGDTNEALIASADLAMCGAKERRKYDYEFFHPSMNEAWDAG